MDLILNQNRFSLKQKDYYKILLTLCIVVVGTFHYAGCIMTSMFTFYFLRYCNHNSQATLSQKLNKSAPTLIYPSSHAFKPLYVKPFTAFSTFHSRKKKSVVLFLEKRESLEGCYLEQYVLESTL